MYTWQCHTIGIYQHTKQHLKYILQGECIFVVQLMQCKDILDRMQVDSPAYKHSHCMSHNVGVVILPTRMRVGMLIG